MGCCNDVFDELQRTVIAGNDFLDGNVMAAGLHAVMYAADIDGAVTCENDIGANKESLLACILNEIEVPVRLHDGLKTKWLTCRDVFLTELCGSLSSCKVGTASRPLDVISIDVVDANGFQELCDGAFAGAVRSSKDHDLGSFNGVHPADSS